MGFIDQRNARWLKLRKLPLFEIFTNYTYVLVNASTLSTIFVKNFFIIIYTIYTIFFSFSYNLLFEKKKNSKKMKRFSSVNSIIFVSFNSCDLAYHFFFFFTSKAYLLPLKLNLLRISNK